MECPFCGSCQLDHMICGKPAPMAWIYCKECGAQGPTSKTLEEAVDTWNQRNPRKEGARMTRLIYTLIILVFSEIGSVSAASRQDLQNEISNLNAQVVELQTKLASLSAGQAKLISRYKMTNAGAQALSAIGVNTAAKGQTVQVPVTFIPGPLNVAGLQQDVVIPSSFTLVSIAEGPASTAAGKGVQFNNANGLVRLLVFGVNSKVIGAGVLAILTLKSAGTIPNGVYPITVVNPVASNETGLTVPFCVTSGGVKIQ